MSVGMPYVRHVQDKLWEMRGRGKSGIGRSFYVAHVGHQAVILHSFVKKAQKTPDREIRVALTRARELENGTGAGSFAQDDGRA